MYGTSKVRTTHADAQADDQMGRPATALETKRIDVSGVANGHLHSFTGIREGSSLWFGSVETNGSKSDQNGDTRDRSGNEAQPNLRQGSVVSERSHLKH